MKFGFSREDVGEKKLGKKKVAGVFGGKGVPCHVF